MSVIYLLFPNNTELDSPSAIFLKKLHWADGGIGGGLPLSPSGQCDQGLDQLQKVSRIKAESHSGFLRYSKSGICETLILKRQINELRQRNMDKYETLGEENSPSG